MTRFYKHKFLTIHDKKTKNPYTGQEFETGEKYCEMQDAYMFETQDPETFELCMVGIYKKGRYWVVSCLDTGCKICTSWRNGSREEAVNRFESLYNLAYFKMRKQDHFQNMKDEYISAAVRYWEAR